jgi:CBS-domain-containing membrane protein
MAARKVQTSEVADSIKKLMAALDHEKLPSVDEMRKRGWVTASDYAKEVGLSSKRIKDVLNGSKNVVAKKARSKTGPTMMYKAR